MDRDITLAMVNTQKISKSVNVEVQRIEKYDKIYT